MSISKTDFDDFFSGYNIHDCAIRARDSFCFLGVEDCSQDAEPIKALINYFPDSPPGKTGGRNTFHGFSGAKIAASKRPKEQAVMIARDGGVAVLGGGERGLQKSIPKGAVDQPIFTSVHALATIDGYIYAVGPWRSVCRRNKSDNWENLADRKTLPASVRNSSGSNNDGFDAIDGFNANDIYCAGGHGDVWRFDGTRWYQCAVPTNMIMENVCCAGDGYVYIGMQSGSVMRGREDTWEIIHKGNFTLPFKDIVWFDDKAWCTSDYGIWTIENGKLTEPDLPADVRACAGNLSVGDGVMLLAGMYGATVYDGKDWTRLV